MNLTEADTCRGNVPTLRLVAGWDGDWFRSWWMSARCLCLILLFGGAGLGSSRAAEENEGRSLFLMHCAPCHGPDGRARTPAARKLGVKDLTQSRLPDPDIRRQIIEGRRDKTGKQQMPAFEDKLTSQQLITLIAQVKEFRK
jgi:cytochrome c553